MIANLIARLKCRITGHRRGKRVSDSSVECPRCRATWERKKAA